MNFLLCFILILCIGFVFLFYLIQRIFVKENSFIHERVLTYYDTYIKILEVNMDKAFNIIYKDRILVFSLEATTPKDEEVNKITKEFALLVIKLLGPNLKNEFIYLYGDEETFLFNLTEYFTNRFDEDEIRSASQNNLLNDEGTNYE